MKTLVIGLGNPILGDDGVGWRVADQVAEEISRRMTGEAIRKRRSPEDVPTYTWSSGQETIEVDCLAVGGLSLMERMIDCDRAILVDALSTGQSPQGTVFCFPLDELANRAAGHLSSAHDTTIQNALQVGRSLGAKLPVEVMIVAVESTNVYDFSERLSPAVEAAVPIAVQKVVQLLMPQEEK
jgi:hydrogenase maturation protease